MIDLLVYKRFPSRITKSCLNGQRYTAVPANGEWSSLFFNTAGISAFAPNSRMLYNNTGSMVVKQLRTAELTAWSGRGFR